MKIDENHPIYKAIAKGGGQACDVAGVIRELEVAGFEIVYSWIEIDPDVSSILFTPLCWSTDSVANARNATVEYKR